MREKSLLLYWWKYLIVPKYRRYLKRFELSGSEEVLWSTFTTFSVYISKNFKIAYPEDFNTEDQFMDALELQDEILDLVAYWNSRDHISPDRVKDDQMLIRLIRIRHKLKYENS